MVPSDREIAALAEALGRALDERALTVATAESCTGGWIAKAITDVPGSSDWFEAGFVTYSDRRKTDDLGVPEPLLREHGAVSAEVVEAMAEGARQRAQAGIAVAVSGIAGPGGGSAAKPVGTVWLAWASADETRTKRAAFSGDREAVRRQTVAAALSGLIEVLTRSE